MAASGGSRRRADRRPRGRPAGSRGPFTAALAAAGAAVPPWAWALGGALLALGALFFACRGAPLGAAVADDYAYLGNLRLDGKIDPFDSMGSPFYWRPLSRQLYFSLVGPWLRAAPWGAALLHAALFILLYAVLYRSARRALGPPAAAALASFPLLAEPARVLLAWPSGAHYLLLVLAAAIALAAAFADRRRVAAAAALAALLAHESGVLVVLALPVIAHFRNRSRAVVRAWGIASLAVLVLWGAGLLVARARGVAWPAEESAGGALGAVPEVLGASLAAQLNLEDLGPGRRPFLLIGYAAVAFAALVAATERAARARLARHTPLILGGLAWFVAGSLPLAVVPPWNAWRTALPALGLGVAGTAAAGALHPALAVGFAAVRGAGLLLAAPAPALVATEPPDAASQISFTRLVRLQHAVAAAEEALLARYPTLPRGADVRYWSLPRMTELGFLGETAPRVWYADASLRWQGFGGDRGFERRAPDALVQFSPEHPAAEFAVVIEPEALRYYAGARRAFLEEQNALADSLFAIAYREQPRPAPLFYANVARDQARLAYNRGDFAAADSLNALDLAHAGESPYHAALSAHLAYVRGDQEAAARWLQACLSLDPQHGEGRQLAAQMGLVPRIGGPAGANPP